MENKHEFRVLDRVAHNNILEIATVIKVNKNNILTLCSAEGAVFSAEADVCTFVNRIPARSKYNDLAMYIFVNDTVPTGLGINGAVHVGYLAGTSFKSKIHKEWELKSFRKRTCIASEEQIQLAIDEIKKLGGNFVEFYEDDWHDERIAVAFEARYNWPPIFKEVKLHSGA